MWEASVVEFETAFHGTVTGQKYTSDSQEQPAQAPAYFALLCLGLDVYQHHIQTTML